MRTALSIVLLFALWLAPACNGSNTANANANGGEATPAVDTTQTVTLVFAGDAMQHESQLKAGRRPDGTYDYRQCFEAMRPMLDTTDWAVVNLETTLPGKAYTGYPCFGSPDAFAIALKDAGFDMMLTANNHCIDKGPSGLRRTIKVLDSLGLPHVGTYGDTQARKKALPVITDVKGMKIGWLVYTYGTNGIKARDGVIVDYIDTAQMRRDIALTKKGGAEFIVVGMHWGIEYKLNENDEQRRLARWLHGQGVDVVLGGHPHVMQPTYFTEDKDGRRELTIYSLGNFISGQRKPDTKHGGVVGVTLRRGADGRPRVESAQHTVVTVEPGYRLSVAPAKAIPLTRK